MANRVGHWTEGVRHVCWSMGWLPNQEPFCSARTCEGGADDRRTDFLGKVRMLDILGGCQNRSKKLF